MGMRASARRRRLGVALLPLLSAGALLACNALLGTPEPVLAPDAGADGGTGGDGGGAPGDGGTEVAAESAPPDGAGGDASAGEGSIAAEGGDAGPPSCPPDGGPGVSSCGPTGDSCCTSLAVPGGTFDRSYTSSPDGGSSALLDPAKVSPFRLDEYEVTVGRFRRFVEASQAGWTPPLGSGIHTHLNGGLGLAQPTDAGVAYEQGWLPGWYALMSQPNGSGEGLWDDTLTSCMPSTWTTTAGSDESLPINCVDWFEAEAFCIWDGGFLPSEAEWQLAAAGADQQREYPWGAAPPGDSPTYAIYGCEWPDGGLDDAGGTCTSIANIAPVGSAPLGIARWGHLDMGGSVHEAVFDLYAATYVSPCADCAQLQDYGDRVARGGSWYVGAVPLQNVNRTFYPGDERDLKGGFRCARVP